MAHPCDSRSCCQRRREAGARGAASGMVREARSVAVTFRHGVRYKVVGGSGAKAELAAVGDRCGRSARSMALKALNHRLGPTAVCGQRGEWVAMWQHAGGWPVGGVDVALPMCRRRMVGGGASKP
uniref:Uncharacterized protein n=1 Tax=Oryza barthii TaxID=65489 RepID=A0A0D3GFI4_9ORYZ